jgi:hypothetical protein
MADAVTELAEKRFLAPKLGSEAKRIRLLRAPCLVARYNKHMINDQMTDEHWLTYAEAAEKLGLTVNAVRALARRQGWPRRSPNVIGGQAWVAVPADRLAINGHIADDRRSKPASANDQSSLINDHDPAGTNNQNRDERRPDPASINAQFGDNRQSESAASDQLLSINDHDSSERRPDSGLINSHNSSDPRSEPTDDRRSTEILTAVQEVMERITEPLREQIADLKNQLAAEKLLRAEDKERVDRAEGRVQELRDKLEAEMIEHRRVVGVLADQLSARRSWWPWRR